MITVEISESGMKVYDVEIGRYIRWWLGDVECKLEGKAEKDNREGKDRPRVEDSWIPSLGSGIMDSILKDAYMRNISD